MSKFVCHKCNTEKTIANYRVRVVNNKTVVKEAICCEEYMELVRDFKGWGSIRKGPDGTVKRKPRPWE